MFHRPDWLILRRAMWRPSHPGQGRSWALGEARGHSDAVALDVAAVALAGDAVPWQRHGPDRLADGLLDLCFVAVPVPGGACGGRAGSPEAGGQAVAGDEGGSGMPPGHRCPVMPPPAR